MEGRAQSGWKVSYLSESSKRDLLSSSSTCNAVVWQVRSRQGQESTCTDTFPPSQQFPICKSTSFALVLHWSKWSGWCWVVTNCDSALGKTRLIHKLVKRWADGALPVPPMGTNHRDHLGARHGPPLLPVCRSHGLPQTQLWLLYSAVLCGRQSLLQNAFLTHPSRLSRHATLLFSILRMFFFRGSVAVKQSPELLLFTLSFTVPLWFIKKQQPLSFLTFIFVLF